MLHGKNLQPLTGDVFVNSLQVLNSPQENPCTYGESVSVTFNLRYPGQYFDKESNLHYNYFRSYDSRTGRYTQSDPIGLQGGWNRFAYVESNPLSNIDPLGLQTFRPRGIPLPGPLPGPGGGARPIDPFEPGGPTYTPTPRFKWPDWLTRRTDLEACEADCEQEKVERDALCFIAQAMGGKSAQRECLSRSDQIAYQCRKKCKENNCQP